MTKADLYRDPYDDFVFVPNRHELPADVFQVTSEELDAILGYDMVDLLPVRHIYAPGLYLREMTIPAGVILTSRRYLFEHVCILSGGQISVWGHGHEPEVMTAPHVHHGAPGERRNGYAHETITWTTVFPNPDDCRDPETIMARFTEIPPEVAPVSPPEAMARLKQIFGVEMNLLEAEP